MELPEVPTLYPAPPPDSVRESPLARLGSLRPPEVRRDASGLGWVIGAPYAVELGFRPMCLDVHLPAPGGRPAPVVLFLHGGAFMVGDRRELSPPLERLDIFRRLPLEGFAIATADYRLSAEVRFPGQLHDLKAAVRWLRAWAPELGIDGDRVAVWGESAGGHLAAMLGTTSAHPATDGTLGVVGPSARVQAVIDWYGPTDFAAMDRQAPVDSGMTHDDPGSPESLLVGAPVQERPDLVAAADPACWATADCPPFLIQHGTRDRLVPFGQSVHLHERLVSLRVPSRLIPIQGADHGFEGHHDDEALLAPVLDHLRDALAVR